MFNPGDNIRCIDNGGVFLDMSCIYEVDKVNIQGGLVYLKGKISGFYATRFILVDQNKPQGLKSGVAIEQETQNTLPVDSNARKNYPIYTGCVRYFPAALAGIANTSKLGNDKHNPGQELHHARGKSMDHGNCIIRHLMDVEDLLAQSERNGSPLTPKGIQDILTEVNQMAWRALAFSQEIHEKFGAPLAPGAKK